MTGLNNAVAALCRPPVRARRGRLGASSHAVLRYMREFFERNDQLPPMEFISAHMGWASPNAAATHVARLERAGLIERNEVGKCRFRRD